MIGELFPHADPVRDPEVVYLRTRKHQARSTYLTKRVPGLWYRVKVSTFDELTALRGLAHEKEKFAPAEGEGVLISERAMRKIQS